MLILHHKPSREGGRLAEGFIWGHNKGSNGKLNGWNVIQADSCTAARVCTETGAGLGVPPTGLQLLQVVLVQWGQACT